MLYETKFLISLFLTLIIEIPIVLIISKYLFKLKIKKLKIVFIGFIASFSTLPYIWFVLYPYLNLRYYLYTVEILVFLFESLVYNQLLNLKFKNALFISFIANLASFSFGLLIM